MSTYFCDGVKEVSIFNGVARLEFFRFQAAKANDGNGGADALSEVIVAMPPQGLLQALSVLVQFRDKLVKDGVLVSTAPENSDRPRPDPESSPNFQYEHSPV